MIKPQALRKGDKVAIVSLSSGLGGEEPFKPRLTLALSRLSSIFGLEPVIMQNALKGCEYLYYNPEVRARDLMDAFRDPGIRAVFSVTGGDDTIRILPYVDFEALRSNPKIFMGYSDTTVNHFMMYKAGIASYSGPCILAEFAENVEMHEYTIDYIWKTLFHPEERTDILSSPYWTSEYLEWTDRKNDTVKRTMKKEEHGFELLQGTGIARGELLGGCLGVFCMMTGTRIWPAVEEWKGKILFLETAEDYPTPESVRYFLRGLAAQGIIDAVNGIVVGKPLDEKYYDEYKDVYRSVIGGEAGRTDLPILYNVNCSHTAPVCIMPNGIRAEIDCDRKTFALIETPVALR